MPVVGSIVGEIAAPVSSGIDSSAGGVSEYYRFDGVGGYATAAAGFVSKCKSSQVFFSFTIEKIGVAQVIIDSATGYRLGIDATNHLYFSFEPANGGARIVNTHTETVAQGQIVSYSIFSAWYIAGIILGTYTDTGGTGRQKAIFNTAPKAAEDASPINTIGASATPDQYFRGPIHDLRFVDYSVIQGRYTNRPTTNPGTGLISTPIPIVGNFIIEFWTTREADNSGTRSPLGSSANADNYIKFFGASHASQPNDIELKIGGTAVTWTQGAALIAPGQQYLFRLNRISNVVTASIDLWTLGTKTLSTNGVLDMVGRDYTSGNTYPNGLNDLTITSTFGTANYSLEQENAGTNITNLNATSGSTYNGAWQNLAATIWELNAKNNRIYPGDEGAGQYLYDSLETGTTNKFTIQNYNALNWMPLGAVNYYVDPTAAASGSGYASTPFDDFTEINADNSIVAGGTIHIKRAQMVRGSLALSGVVGVHVQPYGTGTDPTINGSVIEAGTWAQDGTNGNAWYLAWTGAIASIWVDNVLLTNKSTSAAMQSDNGSQWFDDSGNKMWVNAAVAPNSATIIEVVRAIDSVVSVVSSSGVHIRDIKAEKGADHGFSFSGSTVNSSLARCEANKVGGWRGDDSGFLLEGLSPGFLSTGINITDCAASECQGDGLKSFKQLFMTVRNFAATSCGRGVTLWGETKASLFQGITTRTIAAAPGASGGNSLLIRDDSGTDTGNNTGNLFLSCDFESNNTNTVKVLDGNGDNTLRSTRVSIGADPGSGGAAGLGLVYNGQNDGGKLYIDDCTIVNPFSSGSPDQVLVNTLANTQTVFTKNTYYQPNGTNSTYIYLGVTYTNADRAAAFSAFAAASGETGSYGEP